jgi:hypothetical protein
MSAATWPECETHRIRLQLRLVPRGYSPAAPMYFCPACEAAGEPNGPGAEE